MKIFDITGKSDDQIDKILSLPVKAIKEGSLVIFPTETVYGLGADCFNPVAVNKIFLVKRRPYTDPLIVHIGKISQLKEVVSEIPEVAKKIIEKFWPGPLSIVLKKHPKVPYIVTGGLDSVCVRYPEDIIARKFISLCGVPISAPSANIFSRVSATDIEHIKKDFSSSKEIKYVIYSGRTKYGVESTIIDCTTYPVRLLRYGAIEVEKISSLTGIKIVEPRKSYSKVKIKKSPGMFKKHYSPTKPTFLARNLVKYVSHLTQNEISKTTFVCFSLPTEEKLRKIYKDKICIIHLGDDVFQITKNLYLCLRLAEDMNTEKIVIESVKHSTGLWKTVKDRITKSAGNKWVD